ncbi:MAG: hypothetical protein Q8R37_00745 [Nanoarchaeota archaeon]|nr:hypothetical protein [Nanoarchaeota archaeon]
MTDTRFEALLYTARTNGKVEDILVLADHLQEINDPRGELIVRDLEGKTTDKQYQKLTRAMEHDFRKQFADYPQTDGDYRQNIFSLHPEWHCGFLKSIAITNPSTLLLDQLVSDYGALLQNLKVSFTNDEVLYLNHVLQHPIMKTLHSLIIDEEECDIPKNTLIQTKIDAPQLHKIRMDYVRPGRIRTCLRNGLLPLGTIEDLEFRNYNHTASGRRNNPILPILNLSYLDHTQSLKKLGFVYCGVNGADIMALIDSLELLNLQSLDLSHNEHLGPEELEYLLRHAPTALPALREIVWYGNEVINPPRTIPINITVTGISKCELSYEGSGITVYAGDYYPPDNFSWEKTPSDSQQWPDDEITRYDLPAVLNEEDAEELTELVIDDFESL